jgi:hypothetical protein
MNDPTNSGAMIKTANMAIVLKVPLPLGTDLYASTCPFSNTVVAQSFSNTGFPSTATIS